MRSVPTIFLLLKKQIKHATVELIKTISGMYFQPNQEPIPANNLKSPPPIPSFPTTN